MLIFGHSDPSGILGGSGCVCSVQGQPLRSLGGFGREDSESPCDTVIERLNLIPRASKAPRTGDRISARHGSQKEAQIDFFRNTGWD